MVGAGEVERAGVGDAHVAVGHDLRVDGDAGDGEVLGRRGAGRQGGRSGGRDDEDDEREQQALRSRGSPKHPAPPTGFVHASDSTITAGKTLLSDSSRYGTSQDHAAGAPHRRPCGASALPGRTTEYGRLRPHGPPSSAVLCLCDPPTRRSHEPSIHRRPRRSPRDRGARACSASVSPPCALLAVAAARPLPAVAIVNTAPPAAPVKLVFIHHSTGQAWLEDGHGGLGIALRDNNYFVSDTNYGWGPELDRRQHRPRPLVDVVPRPLVGHLPHAPSTRRARRTRATRGWPPTRAGRTRSSCSRAASRTPS